ncbi:MAG: lipid A export permease/ATP-binding protein MsbA [Gammaproteobacteria bacterium]|nr:lipid A export permease/ATP-binding protein MsbA [Gammaproteobacteria bacterium]
MHGKALYIRLLQYVRPYKKTFALSILATVILALTEPGIPYLLKFLLDGSFVEKDPEMILLIPILLVLLFAVRGFATFGSVVALEWVATKVVTDLRNLMFNRLLSLPVSYYDSQATGVVLSKISYDVEQVTMAASKVLVILVRDSITIIGLLSLIFYLNWQLALFTLTVVPAIALIVKIVSKRLRKISIRLQQRMGDMTHILEEGISGNRVVRLFGGQQYELTRFAEVADSVRQLKVKMVVASNLSSQMVQTLAIAALAIMAYFAAQQSAAGQLTVGDFTAFFGAMALLLAPLKRLTNINEHLQRGLAAAESIFAVLDKPLEPAGEGKRLEQAQGNISFRQVEFQFEGADRPTLDDISIDIKQGEHVALVGPSGSGKSTLASLLPLFYRPEAGLITLDGIDIAELDVADLRRHISLVSQDVVLFNDSVRANIAYGELAGADKESVKRAAASANALGFIQDMQDGFNTEIGANGIRLSGGQRQRLAIARALLKDAPVLILDEATSALDTESERAIQEAVERLKSGRTTLTIAHRLSTIESADRILVLDKGRVVETGRHPELIAANGLYARLYQARLSET